MPTLLTRPQLAGNPLALAILNESLGQVPIPEGTGSNVIVLKDFGKRSIGRLKYCRTYHKGNTNSFDLKLTIYLYDGVNIANLKAQVSHGAGKIFDSDNKEVEPVNIKPTRCTREFEMNFEDLHTSRELTLHLV